MLSNSLNDALIYIYLSSITNISKQKFSTPLLTVFLGRGSTRSPICSKQCNLSGQKWSIDQQGLALAHRNDYLQLQLSEEGRVSASMKFPLEQLLAMPRVSHEIECLLLKNQKWDSIDRSPLRHTAQVDLSMMAFNRQLGKLVISSVEVELTRNTELIGKMDPFVQFRIDGEVRKTSVREDEGMHCIWHERIQFQFNDVNKSFALFVSVLDKDNVSSDVVGAVAIDLIQQRMLLPQEEIRLRGFTLLFQESPAGRIKIQFQFIPKQFNF